MFERVKNMIIKEFIQTFRNKRMRLIIFFAPVMQLLVFGYAVNMDIKNVSTAFYDADKSSYSRLLAGKMDSSGYFNVKYYPSSFSEVTNLIDKGECVCAVCIDRDFARDIKAGRSAKIQICFDGTDSNTALIAMSYLQKLISDYGQNIEVSQKALPLNIDLRTRIWYNPDLKSANFFVPGVMATLIMLICLLLTAMAIVREKEIGTLEQIMVSPIKPFEFILGKTIPFAVIAFVVVFIVITVGMFVFGVPIKGNIWVLLAGVLMYLFSVLGLGIALSTAVKTQQQALMATFIIFMPAILISGFIFPIENMPRVIQYVTYLNPLRYFLVIIRGVFLKGNGFSILWPQFVYLGVLGTALLAGSSIRFKKYIS